MAKSHYRAGYIERIETGHILGVSPETAAKWLADNWQAPSEHATALPQILGVFHDDAGRRLLEYLAVRRRHPLVTLAVAKFGYSLSAIQKAYDQGGASIKHAALANPRGGMHLRQAGEVLSGNSLSMAAALLENEWVLEFDLLDVMERQGIAREISDTRFVEIVRIISRSLRLQAPSVGFGAREELRAEAWHLASTVPTTVSWADALSALIAIIGIPASGATASATERWRASDVAADEAAATDTKDPFFKLRFAMAAASEPDAFMLASDDLALRCSFYQRFRPSDFRSWSAFAERDGLHFLNFAVRNEAIWRTAGTRNALEILFKSSKIPLAHMARFKCVENKFRVSNPEWFRPPAQPKGPNPELEAIRFAIADIADRMEAIEVARDVTRIAAGVQMGDLEASMGIFHNSLHAKVTEAIKKRGIFG